MKAGAPPAESLSAALEPRSIAIVGASDNPHKIGGRPLMYLARFGYKGTVYPINPNRSEVQGFRAFSDVASLPEAPDLAIVATPADRVADAVAACARRGVRATIVMASGFAETSGVDAIEAERALVATARAAGMRLIGPNSQGLANFGCGAVASFSTMFLEVPPEDGPVAIVSQSGMMSVAPYGLLRRRGIGVRHTHATGNDADVTLAELALAVVQDPFVRLLLLYVESIRDPDHLAAAAAIARERDVPIVAIKAGRTARGQAAARSHTAALAGEDRVVDAFFRRHGIWRVRDLEGLVGCAELYLRGWRPNGRRLVAISNSGATCVMAADTAHDVGLELASLDATTTAALRRELPAFATVTNPIDITAALLTNSRLLGTILPIAAADRQADLLFLGIPIAGVGYDVPAFVAAAKECADTSGKPLVVAAPQENIAAQFRAAGVPTFTSETQAMEALSQLARHAALLRTPMARAGAAHATGSSALSVQPGATRFLDEEESLTLLRKANLPVVPFRLCRTRDDVVNAYRELGPRVVVKGCAAQFPHKSEHGLVRVNVAAEGEAVAAFGAIAAALLGLGVDEPRVIVATMMARGHEMMLGVKVDPVFGPVLLVGEGGRFVEAVNDVAVLVPPVSSGDVDEAIQRLRVAPILRGVRGDAALDVDALCAAAVRLIDAVASGSGVASIDLNPVMLRPRGEGAVVVDAVIERTTRSPAHT
jgi:acyl-CoA synthetase (NDP forming)